jgi:hypothetical protein
LDKDALMVELRRALLQWICLCWLLDLLWTEVLRCIVVMVLLIIVKRLRLKRYLYLPIPLLLLLLLSRDMVRHSTHSFMYECADVASM